MSVAPPNVSVIIPCYNAERYVGDAIQSALGQTYPQTEVIVIDDGSTDGSLDVIKSFCDAIRWEAGPNRGACAARNRGLELAQGELIQFLDADDLLFPDKLERQVPEVLRRPESVVYCDYEVRTVSGERVDGRRAPTSLEETDSVIFLLRHWGLQTSAPIHWASSLRAVGGFREELPCSQERDLHLRLACTGRTFRFFPEVLYALRVVPGSVSRKPGPKAREHVNIAWYAYKCLRETGRLTDECAAQLGVFVREAAYRCFECGDCDEGWQYLYEARRMHRSAGYTGIAATFRPYLGARVTEYLARRRPVHRLWKLLRVSQRWMSQSVRRSD